MKNKPQFISLRASDIACDLEIELDPRNIGEPFTEEELEESKEFMDNLAENGHK